MTIIKRPEVFEYLVDKGDLMGTVTTAFDFVDWEEELVDSQDISKGRQIIITAWRFPETQPTTAQIEVIEASVAFVIFLTNRNEIIQKSEAEDIIDNIDTPNKKILRAYAEVLLDAINESRQRHGLSLRTLTQLKNSIKSKL